MPKSNGNDIITSIDVFNLYFERMALYTYQSPLCRKLVKKFIADHEDDVLENLKDILDGKYELNYLLGLMATQRKTAVKMMATYITAIDYGDMDLFANVMRAYNKDAVKLKLLPIRKDHLHELYSDIIESDNPNKALEEFTNGWLNTPTKAFYPIEALIWSAEKEDGIKEKLFFSAYLAVKGPADIIRGRLPHHPDFFDYLMRRAQKEFFVGNTMSSLFMRDVNYLKTHKLSWAKNNYGTPEYKEYVCIASIVRGISGGGILQEQLLEQITFTKEKKRDIVGSAYAACCFDDDEKFDLDGVAKAISNGKDDSISDKQKQTFRKAINTFDETMFYMVYLNAVAELYRRSALAELSGEFFSPQGQDAAKRLKTAQNRIALIENKNEELEQRLKSLTTENGEVTKQAAEARNKWAGIQSKIESQQTEIEKLRRLLNEERAKNTELEQQVVELSVENESADEALVDVVSEINYREELDKIFKVHKVVFVGGNFNIMSKFSKRNPAAIIIPRNRIATADQQIENADVVLMKTDSMSHKEYYKFKQIAVRKGIPFGYIENRANVRLMEQDVFETLELMGFADADGQGR